MQNVRCFFFRRHSSQVPSSHKWYIPVPAPPSRTHKCLWFAPVFECPSCCGNWQLSSVSVTLDFHGIMATVAMVAWCAVSTGHAPGPGLGGLCQGMAWTEWLNKELLISWSHNTIDAVDGKDLLGPAALWLCL